MIAKRITMRGGRCGRRKPWDAGLITELVRAQRQVQPMGWAGGSCGWCLKGHWPGLGVQLGRDRFFTVLRQSGLLLAPFAQVNIPQTTSSYHCLPVFKNPGQGLRGEPTPMRCG